MPKEDPANADPAFPVQLHKKNQQATEKSSTRVRNSSGTIIDTGPLLHESHRIVAAKGTERWAGIIGLIALVFLFRLIVLGFSETRWGSWSSSFWMPLRDLFWGWIVSVVIATRCMVCYYLCVLKVPLTIKLLFLAATELISSTLIHNHIVSPIPTSWMYGISLIYDFKMYSFFVKSVSSSFPPKSDYIKFLFYPTLVYSTNYATKAKIDKKALMIAIFNCILFSVSFLFTVDLCIVPVVVKILKSTSNIEIMENFAYLSGASPLAFYLMFKAFFVGLLTAVGELLRFDGEIYDDWWSAKTSNEFWRKWNIPVHMFIKEHVYDPLLNNGISRNLAAFICFTFSGLVHEYIISMTLKSLNGWFFWGMMMQMPLHYVTTAAKRLIRWHSSMFFWFWFSGIGQPLTIILVYKDYYNNMRY